MGLRGPVCSLFDYLLFGMKNQGDQLFKEFLKALRKSLAMYRKAGVEPTLAQWIKDAEKKLTV